MMGYYGDYGYGFDPVFGIFGFIWHILLLVLVIWLAIALLRGIGLMGKGHRRWMWHTHSALSLLNERFAKGEIDKAEYEERKKALMEM